MLKEWYLRPHAEEVGDRDINKLYQAARSSSLECSAYDEHLHINGRSTDYGGTEEQRHRRHEYRLPSPKIGELMLLTIQAGGINYIPDVRQFSPYR